MIFENGHWIDKKEVKYAETIIYKDSHEILTHWCNWPDTIDLDIEITEYDEEQFKLTGKIEDMFLFIYKYILDYKNYTLEDIIKDSDKLSEVSKKYFKRLF